MNCIFCKIINKEIPCYKLFEDEQVLITLAEQPCGGAFIFLAFRRGQKRGLEQNFRLAFRLNFRG